MRELQIQDLELNGRVVRAAGYPRDFEGGVHEKLPARVGPDANPSRPRPVTRQLLHPPHGKKRGQLEPGDDLQRNENQRTEQHRRIGYDCHELVPDG